MLRLTFEARASLSSGCLLATLGDGLLCTVAVVNPLLKLQADFPVLRRKPSCSDQGVLSAYKFCVVVLTFNSTETFFQKYSGLLSLVKCFQSATSRSTDFSFEGEGGFSTV